jgi:serine/threonine-protein kinase HipA
MVSGNTDIFVYAHWVELKEPVLMGILSAHQVKGRKSLSFEYDESWFNGHRLENCSTLQALWNPIKIPES